MAASIAERVAQAVQDALLANPRVTGVEHRVERAREDPFSREEIDEGAINICSREERLQMHSTEVDDCELDIDVEINVRVAGVWESAADAIATQVHTRVMNDAYPGVKLARVRKTGRSPNSEQGDYTPGQLTLTYTFRYLTMADDITAQP